MKRIIAIILCMALALTIAAAQADVGLDVAKRSHDAIMNFLYSHPSNQPDEKYEVEPSTVAPFSPGKLHPKLVQHALNALNSLRFVAGISSNVTENPEYAEMAQAGALVNAVNGSMSHYPEHPAGMSDELYELGYKGTSSSNIASGYDGSPIKALFNGWIHDGDSRNIDRVGHRRWVLDPRMTETAFGAVGRHTTMYAFGFSWYNYDIPARVAWPAQLMPFKWMSSNLPWSVSFRDGAENGASVTIVRRSDGKTWNLYEGSADGYFHIDRGGYGAGDCLIFRPNGISYSLGDHYDVTITGAEAQTVRYSVELYNFDKAESFVNRCYSVILGRGGESEGIAGWAAALRNKNRTASEIIDGFVNSAEFLDKNLSKEQQVVVLYKAMLGREPDPAGLAAWTDVLNQGYPFGSVINGFCGSTEFKNLCADYGIEPGSVNVGDIQIVTPAADMGKIKAFVTRCYSVILGRDPDPDGLNAWADALATGVRMASEIIDGFVNSQEFLTKGLSQEEQVDILYQAMLGRGADPEGKAAWVKVLNEGNPFGVVINGFCGSIEFTNLCAEYGIQPGSVQVKAALVKRVSITPEGSDPEESATYVAYNSEYINEEKIRAFVKHCYETVLGREGDEEGIANYTALVMDGKKTPKRVAYEFVFSPEFQGKIPGNEELIKILYRLYLNREPGAEELAGWIEMLEGGAGLDEVLKGFAESAEFRAIVREMKE